MQDIHSIAGGPIFVGGGGGESTGDRRLRPHHHSGGGGHHHHQSLKCPRCDSLNTKFCYYNNYNLSQPRHFCKNCRRYWTKGGVLRNVPVGGGCRKAKRSKTKTSAPVEPVPAAAETAAATEAQGRDRRTSSHSSSESSSLTATTTAAAGDAVSATSSISPPSFFNIHDYKSMIGQGVGAPPPPPSNPGFDQGLIEQSSGCGLFSDIGNFTGMMASSAEQLPFGFGSVLDQNTNNWSQHQEQKAQHGGEINIPTPDSGAGMFLGQTTVHVDLPGWQGRPSSGSQPFGALDWQPATDQGLFDLPGTVDLAYWGHQSSHWADDDHQPGGLYLP